MIFLKKEDRSVKKVTDHKREVAFIVKPSLSYCMHDAGPARTYTNTSLDSFLKTVLQTDYIFFKNDLSWSKQRPTINFLNIRTP